MNNDIDILMITYNRPEYTKLSLARLLDTCGDDMRVWVWHNGTDEETLEVVRAMQGHPNFYKFHHSIENKKLNEPTNWLWENAEGAFFTKVDDDCLIPYGWADTLRKAHEDNPEFGVIGCWHFLEEDFVPEIANKKIKPFSGGHQIMQNCWVGGSGYVMKRECVDAVGVLGKEFNFTGFCIRLTKKGFINGWYYPFLYQDHFDDPRSEHSLLKVDEDVLHYAPLSAVNNGVVTIEAWQAQLKRSARLVQQASCDPKHYSSWSEIRRKIISTIKKCFGNNREW
jgi:GT2 family glycosyltransferase